MELDEIKQAALKAINDAKNAEALTSVRNLFLSKKSEINQKMGELKNIAAEERKTFGQKINETRNAISKAFEEKLASINAQALDARLKNEKIDISLPANSYSKAGVNPLALVEEEITEIFLGMGYQVYEGSDVESDEYNFELMNIPKDHPAREMQDTFYLSDTMLLRTHTSPAQARAMKEARGGPVRIICPGKCYRRDNDDLTHSHQFMQIEGLLIDKGIHLGHLEKTLEAFVKKLFGEKREIRLRSSYFPFTEPSVEVDVSCDKCGGKGCPTCKGTGYIEILGAGVVNPRVLKLNGYDPKEYSGFAFGVGLERIAMLKYGIDDIRRFYQNDVRFLSEFKRR
ncbi:MAG: phenylalanine--tRNA ligase subunit alpha [Bacilli bacterium]|nr:phenylalanine--tRNA ligase subunit alpha [Bacilli bacterium]